MRGCSDLCAARCRKIQQAGLAKCLEMGQKAGRKNPEEDALAVRKAAVLGYRNAAWLIGRSEKFVRRAVERYAEYAELILKGQPEKRG